MVLRYDGTLAGFLCLTGRAIKERIEVNAVLRGDQPATFDLFNSEQQIDTDRAFAAKVASGLEERLGKGFMTTVAQALFSEEEGIELDLIALLRRALTEGRNILKQLTDPLVSRVDSAALRTGRERHRLLGLLRFEELADSSYLARVEPRCNLVPLLGSHFSRRLGEQCWLIIDMQRQLGVCGQNHQWELIERIELTQELRLSENEQQMADLWRCFYQHISNPGRFNPKLRQQFMPKRYWQYLTELQ